MFLSCYFGQETLFEANVMLFFLLSSHETSSQLPPTIGSDSKAILHPGVQFKFYCNLIFLTCSSQKL